MAMRRQLKNNNKIDYHTNIQKEKGEEEEKR